MTSLRTFVIYSVDQNQKLSVKKLSRSNSTSSAVPREKNEFNCNLAAQEAIPHAVVNSKNRDKKSSHIRVSHSG
ncbi:hypothetical protein Plhal304r1_c047g0128631 [Plasmopara halstedii]